MGNQKPGGAGSRKLEFTRSMFGKYYSAGHIQPPKELHRREFGIITERGGMWRHLGFGTKEELQAFLTKQAPLHAYHSSAYYSKPNARTMEEKTWQGADLIFDLDADHIRGTEDMTMEEMFAAVKVQFQKLVHDFLLGDFGFGEEDVKIVFSGGRGYHAHVSHERVLGLNSHERREIVDFITKPPSIDPNDKNSPFLIKRITKDVKRFQQHSTPIYGYELYPANTPGWRGRTSRGVLDFINKTEAMEKYEVIEVLSNFDGIGNKSAEKIYDSIYKGNVGDRGIDKITRDLNLDVFPTEGIMAALIRNIINELIGQSSGETDEPVTSDIKRLIRLSGSVHGKTGFVVKPMAVDDLDGFLPLRDSVWPGFDGTVKVTGIEDYEIKLGDERFRVEANTETELPCHAAIFFLGQKKADIPN